MVLAVFLKQIITVLLPESNSGFHLADMRKIAYVYTVEFLVLTGLLFIPGLLVVLFRWDLKRELGFCALLAIPFAFTERFFVPTYWHPPFLFNLQSVLGFGIEDFLFVISLSITACCGSAWITRTRLVPETERNIPLWIRVGVVPLMGILVGIAIFIPVNMIYSAVLIMVLTAGYMFIFRPDLIKYGCIGAIYTAGVYLLVLLVFEWIFPGVFQTYWSLEALTSITVGSIPIEEIWYTLAAGLVGTPVYKFMFQKKLVRTL
jgi:hypothetical protein